MEPQVNSQLIEQVKNFRAKGLPAEKMTAALLAAGWVEPDVNAALFETNQASATPHAEAALAMSDARAESEYDKHRRQTILDGLAGSFGPNGPMKAHYEVKFYDDIGVGWWSTHALDLVALAIAYKLNMPWIYLLVGVGISAHIAYSTYKVIWWRRHKKNY
jgi:hypothetical protein